MELNRGSESVKIAIIGLSMLTTLLITLLILARTLDVEGATIAYLASNTILLPVALKKTQQQQNH